MALVIPKKPRYRKRIGAFAAADYKHDESVLEQSTAANIYNFDFSSGALRDGYGIMAHKIVPSDAARFWVYRYYNKDAAAYVDQCVYQLVTGHLQYYDSYTGRTRFISGIAYPPATAMNYRIDSEDVLLLSCEGRKLMSWNGSRLSEYESPVITSMALHYERLFVTSKTDPTVVYFSDDLDPTNWNFGEGEGGFIELLDERGELTRVVSFADYLYIFRERGISRVSAFGDQRTFSVTNLYVSAGRIYPDSIAVCGNVIMFAASDGLYMFDGYDTVKVLRNLDGLIDYASVGSSAYFNGKYFMPAAMNFNDGKLVGCEAGGEFTRNGLLVYDTSCGEYSITRGLDIDMITVCTFLGEELCFAHESSSGGVLSRCGMRFDVPLEKHWESPISDFGVPEKIKFVREIFVDGNVELYLSVSDGERTKQYYVKAGKRRVRPNIGCTRLKLAVDTKYTDCNIAAPTMLYSLN